MKVHGLWIGLIASTMVVAGCASSKTPTVSTATTSPSAAARAAADRVLAALISGDFATVTSTVDPSTKTRKCGKVACSSELEESNIKDVWNGAVDALGPYASHGTPLVAKSDGDDLFDYPLAFRKGKAHLQLRVNSVGKLTGWALSPGTPTSNFGN